MIVTTCIHVFHHITGKCKVTIDVGFVMDVSGSIGQHWQEEKAFVKTLAENLNVSPDGSHVSVATFDDKAQLNIRFSDTYDNITALKAAIDAVPCACESGTRIDLGLNIALDKMFHVVNGMRTKVHKVVILITDGKQTTYGPSLDTLNYAKKFTEAGINIFVVGVGNVSKRQLLSVVMDKNHLFYAKDFDELNYGVAQSLGQCTTLVGKSP